MVNGNNDVECNGSSYFIEGIFSSHKTQSTLVQLESHEYCMIFEFVVTNELHPETLRTTSIMRNCLTESLKRDFAQLTQFDSPLTGYLINNCTQTT